MATEEVFLGTWKIVECVSLTGTVETTGIEGTEFVLDEGGDVSWKVSEEAESLPFFNCETYELNFKTHLHYSLAPEIDSAGGAQSVQNSSYPLMIVADKTLAPKSITFIGTYTGLEVNFKVEISDDLMLLTYERCCMLQCQKVSAPDPNDDIPFSFLGALEEGYFSDMLIKAESGKEFPVHLTILSLSEPSVDWSKVPTPLTGLPDDVVEATLHYMYAECLPRGMSEETAAKCVKMMSRLPGLTNFVTLCDTFLKNTALKQQITNLVTDMHTSADKIIELFSGFGPVEEPQEGTEGLTGGVMGGNMETLANNPAKLCYIVKQCLREAAVAISKLLILCDLYSRRKSELSREERHKIIKYAKSRIPVFMKQWERFLEVCKVHTTNLTPEQRHDIASYLVPEVWTSLEIVTQFVTDGKAALEQIISGSEASEKTEKSDKAKKGNVGDMLGKTLKNALHVRELKKLKKLHDRSSTLFFHFMQKKESFCTMTEGEKVRSLSKLLEQLVDTIQIGQMKIQDLLVEIDAKLTWRDWKYIFKLGTSKISWAICKLLSNRDKIQTLVKQLCDTVHRDQFTTSLTALNLLDAGAEHSKQTSTSSCTAPQKTKYIQLSSIESLCIPPYARDSQLAQSAVKLLHSNSQSDLVFEVIVTNETGDTVIDHTSGEPVEKTESEKEDMVFEIPAHRVVIATRCDWFRRALLSGMRESIDRKITVRDTNPQLFRLFLEFLYRGELDMNDLTTEQLADMMTLADRYDMVSLRCRCEHTLKHHLDEDTVFYLLCLADQLSAKTLKEACFAYISEHPGITTSDVFQDLPEPLQMEVEALTIHSNLHSNTQTPSSVSSMSEMEDVMNNTDIMDRMNIESGGTSSSSDDMIPSLDSSQLAACIDTMRDIVGDEMPHEELVQAALAADCDVNRAINFLFA